MRRPQRARAGSAFGRCRDVVQHGHSAKRLKPRPETRVEAARSIHETDGYASPEPGEGAATWLSRSASTRPKSPGKITARRPSAPATVSCGSARPSTFTMAIDAGITERNSQKPAAAADVEPHQIRVKRIDDLYQRRANDLKTLVDEFLKQQADLDRMTKAAAVVIGGTGVLGGAIAQGLADAGAKVTVIGRTSPYSLYDQDLVTFEEGKVAYDHRDAGGFIKLNALRLRLRALGQGGPKR